MHIGLFKSRISKISCFFDDCTSSLFIKLPNKYTPQNIKEAHEHLNEILV